MRRLVVLALVLALFAAGIAVGRATAGPTAATASPRWTVAGELSRSRAYARAVALETGEILVVGGLDSADSHVTIPTSEVFDPATGRSSVIAQTMLGRLNQGLTVAWGGRVVMSGGSEWLGDRWNSVANVDVYLPWTHTWIAGAKMRQARSDHGATALLDGRVLVAGGNQNTTVLSSAEIYDVATDRWSEAAPLPVGRTQLSMASLPDGSVLVAGGFDATGAVTTATYVYEPWNDAWVVGPQMRESRLNHSMVRLQSGDLLFFGGEGIGGETAERYSWRERRFVYAGMLGEPRLVAQGATLPDGTVVAVGGLPVDRQRKAFLPLADAELWDPAKRVWRDIVDAPSQRAYAQLVAAGDALYLISGVGDGQRSFSTIEELDWE